MKFKNEALVGMVVTAALVVVAVGGYWLTGRPWAGEQREVAAAFRDVGLLSSGSRVKFRGVTVGRVEEVKLLAGGDGVIVSMTVDPSVTLPPDAGVMLAPESFFGDWQAEIVSTSQFPDMDFVEVAGRDVLPGAALPDITELTAVAARIAGSIDTLSQRVQLAFTEETALEIRRTIENVAEISAQLEGFVGQQTQTYAEVSRNVLQSTENIRELTVTAQRAAQDLGASIERGDIEATLGNARAASENLRLFSEQLSTAAAGVPSLVATADTTLAAIGVTAQRAGDVIGSLQPAVDSLAPTLMEARAAIATLNRAAQQIEAGQGTLGRLIADPALYEETQRAIVTLQRLLADLQANPGKYIGEVQVFE